MMNADNSRYAIVLENIKKSFRQKRVLENITGTISAGTTVGLLGRNGEGKTTLFRILLDIFHADAGKVNVLGHSPDGSSQIRKIAGYVPERPVFHSFMKVSDVLRYRQCVFPTWDSEYVQNLTRDLDLDLNTRIQGASKGTLAKIAWICAVAHHPKLLILDEPTSGLDPIVRDALLMQCVREQSIEGKTVLIASHHMEEWFNLLDEIWVLSGGLIASRHSVEDLRQNAIRITGKLKHSSIPAGLAVIEEFRNGDLVRWLTLDPEVRSKIQSLSILDQMDSEPLPLESTLKLLLQKEANHVG